MLNFSRVAFVFSRFILIKAWYIKRDGGPENGLFCVFLHWCWWARKQRYARDALGAIFHTHSKTFSYARGLSERDRQEKFSQKEKTRYSAVQKFFGKGKYSAVQKFFGKGNFLVKESIQQYRNFLVKEIFW